MADSKHNPFIIHIWAPAPKKEPEQLAHMLAIAEQRYRLTTLLQQHGIDRIDVTPPLPSLTYLPQRDAPDDRYELIPQSDLTESQIGVIRDAFMDILGFEGTILKAQSAPMRTKYMKDNGLNEVYRASR